MTMPSTGPHSPTTRDWKAAALAARARGDLEEVKAIEGTMLMLIAKSNDPEMTDDQWTEMYEDLADLHGVARTGTPTLRAGFRLAAGVLMLVK